MLGIYVGIVGYAASAILGAEGDAIRAGLGIALVIAYTIFTLKSSIKDMITHGILYTLGLGLVAYVTKDIVSIIISIYSLIILVVKTVYALNNDES